MHELLSWVSYSPLLAMALLLAIAWMTPPIFEQLRLPGVVGLLLMGAVFGAHGLGVFSADAALVQWLVAIGQYALIFLVALEFDLSTVRTLPRRVALFGLVSAGLPLLFGAGVSYGLLGLGGLAAVTVGALLASHTLLAYGIVQRLELLDHRSVVTTAGATILTDALALLVVALSVLLYQSPGRVAEGAGLAEFALYCLVVLMASHWGGGWLLRHFGQREEGEALVIGGAIALSVLLGIALEINTIFGAFLAGLAVNDALGNGEVKERFSLTAGAVLVPLFYVCVGIGLNLQDLLQSLTRNGEVTLLLLSALLGGKLLAAVLMRWLLAYNWAEVLTMVCLTLPQVATTLAASLVALQVGLLPLSWFYSIVMILVMTAIAGPWLTRRAALLLPAPPVSNRQSLAVPTGAEGDAPDQIQAQAQSKGQTRPMRVIVPVHNPENQRRLLTFAQCLARQQDGQIMPLAIAVTRGRMDDPKLEGRLSRAQALLDQSEAILLETALLQKPGTVQSYLRIDDSPHRGISRAARERNGDLIVMGWSELDLRSRWLGNVTSRVFSTAHCPVVVTRLLKPTEQLKRILVPVKGGAPQLLQLIRFAQVLAQGEGAAIKLLHVCDRDTPLAQVKRLEESLSQALGQSLEAEPLLFRTMVHRDPATAIVKASQGFDLVMLRSMRRHTAGGMTVGDTTTNVIRRVQISIVLLGEPYLSASGGLPTGG